MAESPTRFAVLGSPIAHSLSPLLHRAAARALGIDDFAYERFEVGEAQLEAFLAEHPEHEGLSLTMPLKHRLVELARVNGWDLDADAVATGAGNTLLRPAPGGGEVLNTDVDGIVAAVHEGLALAGTETAPWTDEADVLGAGATAASALAAAARLGGRAVLARDLADSLEGLA